ncbi:tryptophan--tRNA ligase [Patescibacteria group bacterium]|nr:tryptophan--tRNA ligase [Patescibacteria group bacterium]
MRVFSGIQPTGQLHIGNYLGATKNWAELQTKHDCFFMIADLHALTTVQDPQQFSQTTLAKFVELLSVGLNPEKCIIFVQSRVKGHTDLAWILSTLTPLGELERMTQFKDKAKKQHTNINAGLLTYPTLMAADILLYKTQGVPVGKDQTQHLELARTIAKKFNSTYGKVFPEPKTLLVKEGAKIMSLKEPKKKMSKSDTEESSIGIFEEPASIQKKIQRAVTDTGKEIKYDPIKKPGISNLLTIYSLFSDESLSQAEKRFKGKEYSIFKKALADLLIKKLDPLRKKKKELDSRELYVKEILRRGEDRAQSIAETTMQEVREKIGLLKL